MEFTDKDEAYAEMEKIIDEEGFAIIAVPEAQHIGVASYNKDGEIRVKDCTPTQFKQYILQFQDTVERVTKESPLPEGDKVHCPMLVSAFDNMVVVTLAPVDMGGTTEENGYEQSERVFNHPEALKSYLSPKAARNIANTIRDVAGKVSRGIS